MVKIGMRKPNLKSSLKARTTGRAKRAMKRALIPGYGKKGMGWVKNPRKAAYNAVYRRTTVGVGDVARVIAPKRRRRGSGTVVVIGGGPDETPTVAPRRTLAGQITRSGRPTRRCCCASCSAGRACTGRTSACGAASWRTSSPAASCSSGGCATSS